MLYTCGGRDIDFFSLCFYSIAVASQQGRYQERERDREREREEREGRERGERDREREGGEKREKTGRGEETLLKIMYLRTILNVNFYNRS